MPDGMPDSGDRLATLLQTLRDRGIRLYTDGDALRYDAPRGAMTSDLRERLKANKPAILALIGQCQGDIADRAVTPIPAADSKRGIPLSYAQQRFWFLDQLNPANPAYNLSVTLALEGSLNLTALQSSVDAVIARHDILRTTIQTRDGQGVQVVSPAAGIIIDRLDLRNCPPGSDCDQAAEQWIGKKIGDGFDLAHGPLMRLGLVTLGPQRHRLGVVLHHIVCDAWSLGILVQDVGLAYRHFLSDPAPDDPPPFTPLPIQYADYAVWQRDRERDAGETATSLAYWTTRLADAPPVIDLPFDQPRPAMQTFNGQTLAVELSAADGQRLRKLARSQGVTLFQWMAAAFAVYLSRVSAASDLVIGIPVAGRDRTETESLIGCFVNTLPLRVQLNGNPTFQSVLQQVQQRVLDDANHADTPLEKIIAAVHPERNLGVSPLFQVMLAMQNTPRYTLDLPGLSITSVDNRSDSAKYDLTLFIEENPTGAITGAWEFNSDLFKRESAQRMLDNFLTLLHDTTLRPRVNVSDLTVMNAAERRRLIDTWNRTDRDISPPVTTVTEWLQTVCRQFPERPAAASADGTLTYRELDRLSDCLADELRANGIRTDDIVAMALDGSPHLLLAILGILKSGGAFLPLDSSNPPDRIQFMLTDSRARFKVERGGSDDAGLNLIVTSLGSRPCHRVPPSTPVTASSRTHSDSLAYLIYTSGSTGSPKGVMITHGGLLNYLAWAHRTYRVAQGEGTAVVTPVGFDATITSLFLPLLAGKTVCFPGMQADEEPVMSLAGQLAEGIEYGFLKCTPAHLDVLDTLLPDQPLPAPPHDLVIGGEQLLRHRLTALRRRMPQSRFFNEYGPTETVVGCCVHDGSDDAADAPDGIVPIGRPIDNTRLYILDADLNPVPIGVVGELYIAGAGLARGYLNRPDLTAERFIPCPFSESAGARMYRTGDLARYRSDGSIVYCGRSDSQVKIRGFRIEPDEIAAVLTAHPGVRDAVVIADDDDAGRRRLMAYVTCDTRVSVDQNQVLAHLRTRLPEAMVPAAVMQVDAMPLTANGKIDRAALPRPTLRRALATPVTHPPTATERILLDIWQGVLGRTDVTVSDDFFELGGDSILSIQVAARARDAGLRVAPRQVFQTPTIMQLALVAEPVTPSKPATASAASAGAVALTPIQHWFFALNPVNPNYFNQAICLKTVPAAGVDRLRTALTACLERHSALNSRFERDNHGWTARTVAPDSVLAFEYHHLADVDEQDRSDRVTQRAAAAQAELDIEHGPVFRALYFDYGSQASGRLVLIAHHLIVDGVSWRILVDEISTAWRQLHSGAPIDLALPSCTVRDWSDALTRLASLPALDDQRAVWIDAARAADPVPPDFYVDDAVNTWGDTETIVTRLDAETTATLVQQVAPQCGVDMQDLLLTALLRSFERMSCADPVRIDLEWHGRDADNLPVDASGLIAWCTSLFPVRFDAVRYPDWQAQLASVKDSLRRVPGRGIGYGLLRYLHPEASVRNVLHDPVTPSISFNYLGQFSGNTSGSSLFDGLAPESIGRLQAPQNRRGHRLDVIALSDDAGLTLDWIYHPAIHRRRTIERLAWQHLQALTDVARAAPDCRPVTTPSDFPLAGLDRDGLDDLLSQL